ncbi:hypothetical protein KUTeg_000108 [Tegillarca granosa]|uniref:Chromo domain-containing protein n=1 Tax=Tegillarca granosa TaxID=220873 RepID=A0ABQ9FWL0_TEGGR|nr:hypothetical protein KUTeg_000108 [Tegillarca granosa]
MYPGGFHKSPQTIFEKLEAYDIHVPQAERTYPYFMCYDFKALLQNINDRPTDYLSWTEKHVPISVSICSNVPGHTDPHCIVHTEPDELIKNMVEYMKGIAKDVNELAEEKWKWVVEEIEDQLKNDIPLNVDLTKLPTHPLDDDSDDDEEDEKDEEDEEESEEEDKRLIQLYDIYDMMNNNRPTFFQQFNRKRVTEKDILKGVQEEKLFGMVEVDIEVPEKWSSDFKHRLSPYEYFQEMSPLFCTTDVPFEAFGEHMQRHVENHNLSKASRRLLVGGMKAQQILLASPLLKWYLDHRLQVTKVYQVVEYQQQRCFHQFVEEVSHARRKSDEDKDTAIIADMMKVIGNSAYGSMIMDKSKHQDVQYVQGENETCLKGLKGMRDQNHVEADGKHHWFLRTCCDKHANEDIVFEATVPERIDERWSRELFVVTERFVKDGIPQYKLKDYANDVMEGTFYQNQLNKAYEQEVYFIDKVMKTHGKAGKKEYLVRWKGWGSK